MGINYNKLHMYAFYLRRKRFTSERIPCRTAIEAAAQYQQKYQRGDQRIYNPHAISPGRLRQRKETKYRIRQPPMKERQAADTGIYFSNMTSRTF